MKVGKILETEAVQLDKIDAELLMACVVNVGRAALKAFPERELTSEQYARFIELLKRRINGEPIAYLLGHKEFWSLDFLVTPDVLIPRPDTELIVELALENIPVKSPMHILDLGTGSGAIALSVASERPYTTVMATDNSSEALQVAKLNARHLNIKNVEFGLGSWFEALKDYSQQQFNLILSNPPYIANFDPHLSQGDLRFEPNRALVSGEHGMDDLTIIIAQASNYLVDNGMLMVEHGYDQEQLVASEFAFAGYKDIVCFKDLAGVPRVSVGVK